MPKRNTIFAALVIGSIFLAFAGDGLRAYFTPDEMMNLYGAWFRPLAESRRACISGMGEALVCPGAPPASWAVPRTIAAGLANAQSSMRGRRAAPETARHWRRSMFLRRRILKDDSLRFILQSACLRASCP